MRPRLYWPDSASSPRPLKPLQQPGPPRSPSTWAPKPRLRSTHRPRRSLPAAGYSRITPERPIHVQGTHRAVQRDGHDRSVDHLGLQRNRRTESRHAAERRRRPDLYLHLGGFRHRLRLSPNGQHHGDDLSGDVRRGRAFREDRRRRFGLLEPDQRSGVQDRQLLGDSDLHDLRHLTDSSVMTHNRMASERDGDSTPGTAGSHQSRQWPGGDAGVASPRIRWSRTPAGVPVVAGQA